MKKGSSKAQQRRLVAEDYYSETHSPIKSNVSINGPNAMELWFQEGTSKLMTKCGSAGNNADLKKDQERNKLLSTSSDTIGVSFQGRSFQRLYCKYLTLIYVTTPTHHQQIRKNSPGEECFCTTYF